MRIQITAVPPLICPALIVDTDRGEVLKNNTKIEVNAKAVCDSVNELIAAWQPISAKPIVGGLRITTSSNGKDVSSAIYSSVSCSGMDKLVALIEMLS